MVEAIRRNENHVREIPFRAICKGDSFRIRGKWHEAVEDAHQSEDLSYNGFIVYDTNGESYFSDEV